MLVVLLIGPGSYACAGVTGVRPRFGPVARCTLFTLTGSGAAADPHVHAIPDGMVLTGTRVIKTDDKHVTFGIASGARMKPREATMPAT